MTDIAAHSTAEDAGIPSRNISTEQAKAMLSVWKEWKSDTPGLRETPESMLCRAYYAALDAAPSPVADKAEDTGTAEELAISIGCCTNAGVDPTVLEIIQRALNAALQRGIAIGKREAGR